LEPATGSGRQKVSHDIPASGSRDHAPSFSGADKHSGADGFHMEVGHPPSVRTEINSEWRLQSRKAG